MADCSATCFFFPVHTRTWLACYPPILSSSDSSNSFSVFLPIHPIAASPTSPDKNTKRHEVKSDPTPLGLKGRVEPTFRILYILGPCYNALTIITNLFFSLQVFLLRLLHESFSHPFIIGLWVNWRPSWIALSNKQSSLHIALHIWSYWKQQLF